MPGFAEPVMDMERITLEFSTAEKLLDELRGLGRNLHVARFPVCAPDPGSGICLNGSAIAWVPVPRTDG